MPRSLVYTAPNEISRIDDPRNIIFLAGGITGCNNWQHDVIEKLKHSIVHSNTNVNLSRVILAKSQ